MHEGRKHYNIREIRKLLQVETNIQSVVLALYGSDAAFDDVEQAYFLANIAGGAGDSCRIDTKGGHRGEFRDIGANTTRSHGDLIDAVEHVRGVCSTDAVRWIGDLLGATPNLSVLSGGRDFDANGDGVTRSDLKEASKNTLEVNARRLTGHAKAMEYLRDLGLTDATIEHFHLGMPAPFAPKNDPGNPVDAIISSPIIDKNGMPLKRMPRTPIPGISRNPRDPDGWCAGQPLATWDGRVEGKSWLFVCSGLKDQWRLWGAFRGSSLASRIALVACTHTAAVPEE